MTSRESLPELSELQKGLDKKKNLTKEEKSFLKDALNSAFKVLNEPEQEDEIFNQKDNKMVKLTAELYQIEDMSFQLQGTDIDGERFICTYESLDEQLRQDWESLQDGESVYDWDCDEYTDENWIYPFDSNVVKIAVLPDGIPI